MPLYGERRGMTFCYGHPRLPLFSVGAFRKMKPSGRHCPTAEADPSHRPVRGTHVVQIDRRARKKTRQTFYESESRLCSPRT